MQWLQVFVLGVAETSLLFDVLCDTNYICCQARRFPSLVHFEFRISYFYLEIPFHI